ncbi:hypothetical protein SO694_00057064 [Aureococcus anophagefferens]|uniref:Glutamine amidotransferase type-2 domain-containing protein n=1 Tax=Aureococcus anophagefferens TaxID=44056 RepID=A0ABR1FX45_AURAN
MCGNLGLLLVGHDGDAPPEALLEEMARVVAMRGAQSYGFVAAAGGKSMTMHKAVLTKRDDIATALRRAVRRRVGARALATRPLLLAAHLRFATSSRSTAVEAHPHSWLGPVAALPPSAPGAPPPKPTRRLVVITHNGDFEGLDVGRCFGCDLPVMALDALRAWLAVRLAAVRGGRLRAARLALAPLDDARAGDVSLRSAVAAALRRVLDELRDPARAFASSDAEARDAAEARLQKLLSTTSLGARERAAVAEAALRGYSEWDLRSAVWRFLKTAHGAFGLCATTSLAPGAVVLGSVKQPLIVGVGRGFVAYASERAAVHVGAVGAALKYRYVLAEGDAVRRAEATEQGTPAARAAASRSRAFRLDTSPNAAAARAFAKAVFDADRMRRSSLDAVAAAAVASPLAEVVKGGQSFRKGAGGRRACSWTGAGVRLAEAASLTTALTHVLLTELLLALAAKAPRAARACCGRAT